MSFKKYPLLYLIFLTCLPLLLFAQNLPPDKITDWSKAGLPNSVLPIFDTINVLSHGLTPDGATSNSAAFDNLMAVNMGSPTVFYFPPGHYFFDKSITLNSQHVLKGESSDETVFTFNLNGQNHLIVAKGELSTVKKNITAEINRNQNSCSVENTTGLQVGDFIRFQFDDAQLVTSPWAEKSTGQLLEIINIQGNILTTAEPFRLDVPLSQNPYIEKINPVELAGVECLHIERQDATTSQTSNIFFQFAANCWVKGVSSHYANFAHVDIENGSHNHITGCHFKDAFAYGNGGQGYGVVLEFNTSDCLVDNNVFNHLRHSMLLQAGANGNVLSYNYSINPFWNEVGLPEDAAGDLVLHGNYPYFNLLEGNIVQNIVIDDSHGTNGPGNVFLRNRAEYYGIFMNDDIPTDDQAFIGNEVTSSNFLLGYYDLAGLGHFEYGNNIKGTVTPAGTTELFYNSLYLGNDLPEYFNKYELDIAAIGLPNNINNGVNPAKKRYGNGELTLCNVGEDSVIINSIDNNVTQLKLNTFPNPVRDILYIENNFLFNDYSVKILDINGKVIFNKNNAPFKIDISGLNNGLYILVLENEQEHFFQKINVVR
jgi:hypothetical protein